MIWRKSSRSSAGTQADCVELARRTDTVAIRDSKSPQAGHLTLSGEAYAAIVTAIKAGKYDL